MLLITLLAQRTSNSILAVELHLAAFIGKFGLQTFGRQDVWATDVWATDFWMTIWAQGLDV